MLSIWHMAYGIHIFWPIPFSLSHMNNAHEYINLLPSLHAFWFDCSWLSLSISFSHYLKGPFALRVVTQSKADPCATHFVCLETFFGWLIEQGHVYFRDVHQPECDLLGCWCFWFPNLQLPTLNCTCSLSVAFWLLPESEMWEQVVHRRTSILSLVSINLFNSLLLTSLTYHYIHISSLP